MLTFAGPALSQTLLGSDIDGENADDQSGVSVSVSSDGTRVAIGAYANDGNKGHVRVYEYSVGKVTTDIAGLSDFANSVAIQSDGKIVAAGRSNNGTNDDFALVRYNQNGTLDISFGEDGNGKVTTAIGSGSDLAYSVAIQSDGKIVAAGRSNNGTNDDFALVRYNTNGDLDTTFGTGGKVTTAFGATARAYSVAIQLDGKIVAAGYTVPDVLTLVRYNADGSLDTAFGDGGAVTTLNAGRAFSVALQPDGKIVAAGHSFNDTNDDFALVRYERNGTLDTAFGEDGNGMVTTPFGAGSDVAYSVAIQPDGKIVAAGYSYVDDINRADFALVRYNADGTLDTSFGVDENGAVDPAVARFGAARFGEAQFALGTSKVTTPIGSGMDIAFSVAIQPDGKIVAAGYSDNGTNDDFALVRYERDGTLDTSFGGDGKVTTPIGGDTDVAYSVALQSDGKIVLAGFKDSLEQREFALVRYNTDGSLDTSLEAAWAQLGEDIDGEAAGDGSGFSVSLSSAGDILAIGAYANDGNDPGPVRVFKYSENVWTQLGADIESDAAGDKSGTSVSLSSDGTRVAIGAFLNDGNGVNSGHVRVYQYSDNVWNQLGEDIDGEAAGDESGGSVSLSSAGDILAIGAANNINDNGNDSGHVRVFKYSENVWTQLGADIDGEAADDFSGSSVSLSSNGTVLAIGAENSNGNGVNSGHVRVYQYSDNVWNQLGEDIDGEAAGDGSGFSVSLSSDGTRVAIGAPTNINNDNDGLSAGHVRVYEYSGGAWAQLGEDIDGEGAGDRSDGEAAGDKSGTSVSLSSDGTRVAIGAFLNDGNGVNSGHVRVYRLPSAQTITFAQPPGQALAAGTLALTATASSGLPVSYVANPANVCTVANTTATLVGAGICRITAVQDGDATFTAAPTVARAFSISVEVPNPVNVAVINADSVQRLYVAYFNRPADPGGFEFYQARLPDGRTALQDELEVVANTFFNPSQEYLSMYAGMSDSQIVNQLYLNIFGRNAEPGGLNFWANALTDGTQTVESIALQLSYSAQGDDRLVVNNRIEAANVFTSKLDTSSEKEGYVGNAAAASARSWLALVLATDSSKNTAILGADQAIIETTTAGRLSPPVKGFLFEQVKAGIE